MRILASLVIALGLSTSSAFAQAAATSVPPCDGTVVIIRVSEITPAGSMDKLMAAVAAQQAWYKSHGYLDKIFSSKVLIRDSATNGMVYSDKEAITYHFYAPGSAHAEPKHDAGFDAFVKLFQETSNIKDTRLTCVPKAMVPSM